MSKRLLVVAASFAIAALGAPASAQNHPLTRYCTQRYVITGTIIGRMQLQNLAGNQITPELVQVAALWALSPPDRQRQVEHQIRQRMRLQGKWGAVEDDLWWKVSGDAADAVRMAEAGRRTAKPAVGAVLGGVAGGVLGMATGSSPLGWGAAGAVAGSQLPLPSRSPASLAFDVIVGPPLDAALDRLVRSPCTLTAEEALRMSSR